MKISTISIDLAKSVFQLMMFDEQHKVQQERRLSRAAFHQFIKNHPPCKVVMEACYSAHYWGRELQQLGYHVQLIPAQHVTPFVRGNKNDRNDSLAIFEASQRPFIRPVPVKTEYQQEILMLHNIRERLTKQRIELSNQTRGLLTDFGLVFNKGHKAFFEGLTLLLDTELSATKRFVIQQSLDDYKHLREQQAQIETQLKHFISESSAAQILLSLPGVGPIIASAVAASVDKAQAFKSAKDFAVWLGLTPKQSASGNRSKMEGISKRGDSYLRKQIIHGARTLLRRAEHKPDALNQWITNLRCRKHVNCVVVAIAHRLARLMWVLLSRNSLYQAQPAQAVCAKC
ncbi:IS110 family transposase [Rheinheimera riviphila]|uniref:IS110 family transposase n=1 Tax=Rheinheimera riviphila TaxID=1834037 RepID=A0A437QMB4_9GAMM|nr:IS110 family transposase [Rheinheimera riviphila]RVU35580.1 IS110 family transposase [Rheinheimera riviphila]